jgi:thioredoxin 1
MRTIASLTMTLFASALLLATGCGEKRDASVTPEGLPVITASAIDSFVTAGGISLIEFGGKHCGPCKSMRGILASYIAAHPELRVACLYWEEHPEAFKRFSVGAVPAQLVFDASGKERLRNIGVWEESELSTALRRMSGDF